MKKIVSMALIAALIVSAAGCGEKAPAETTAKTETTTAATETVNETTAKEAAGENSAEETAETTAEAEETTTTAPEETSEYAGLSMSNPLSFDNGSLYFEASNDTKYLYQVAENKIYEINKDWINGKSKLCKTGDLMCVWRFDYGWKNYCVVNIATNEVILKNDDGFNLRHFNTETGRILVTKVEEGFSGNSISLGVMNNEGEWEYPLTEFSIDGFTVDDLNDCELLLMGDYIFIRYRGKEVYFYSLKDKSSKKVCDDVDSLYSDSFYNHNGDIAVFHTDDGICAFDASGECKEIYNGRISAVQFADYGKYFRVMANGLDEDLLLSWDGYKDTGFDLSGYDVTSIYDVKENVIAFSAKNPDGDSYNIIMNKDGSFVTEPFSKTSLNSDEISLYGDYAFIKPTKTLLNLKTGESKTIGNIGLVDDKTEMITVEADGEWYLVDLSDPDTLLNPFELAQN